MWLTTTCSNPISWLSSLVIVSKKCAVLCKGRMGHSFQRFDCFIPANACAIALGGENIGMSDAWCLWLRVTFRVAREVNVLSAVHTIASDVSQLHFNRRAASVMQSSNFRKDNSKIMSWIIVKWILRIKFSITRRLETNVWNFFILILVYSSANFHELTRIYNRNDNVKVNQQNMNSLREGW